MSDNALPTYSDYPLKDVFLYGSCAIEPRDHLFTDRYGSQSAISRFVLVGVCPEGDDLLYLDAYMMAPFWNRTRTALGEQRAEFADGLVGFESEEDARAFMADFGIEETGLEIIYAVVEDNKQRIQSHGLNDGKEMKMAENNEVKVPEAKETGKKNIPLRIHKSLVGESFEYKAGETSKMMRRAAFYVPDEENPGSDKRLTAIFDEKAFKDDKFNPNLYCVYLPETYEVQLRHTVSVPGEDGKTAYEHTDMKMLVTDLIEASKAARIAREEATKGGEASPEKKNYIFIHTGKGLVKDFENKNGVALKEVSIPNDDAPWKSFVVPASHVGDDKPKEGQEAKSVWIRLEEEGNTTLKWSEIEGEGYVQKSEKVSNKELKVLMDVKNRERSVIKSLENARKMADEQQQATPAKAKEAEL